MKTSEVEMEVKFLVSNLTAVEARLKSLGAKLVTPREFESNLRFDYPDGTLTSSQRVLRLRQDHRARLTFKGPQSAEAESNVRVEIETVVDKFDRTRRLLEAVGLVVSSLYEKWRTTYQYQGIEAVLDELPFGSFIELEGTSEVALKELTSTLGLDWARRVRPSYLALFDIYRANTGSSLHFLDFASFEGVTVQPEELSQHYAD